MSEGVEYHNPAEHNYAEALFNVAKRAGRLDVMAEEAQVILDVFRGQDAKFIRFIESPQILTEDKIGLIDTAFGGRADPLFVNLLKILVERGRALLAPGILAIFWELVAAERGFQHGRLTSAVGLTDRQKIDLRTSIEAFIKKRLEMEYLIDPGILGGVVFKSRDTLIDHSVCGRLTELRKRLEGARVV
jgi:F-type H+-transporting ATPase subunit delta